MTPCSVDLASPSFVMPPCLYAVIVMCSGNPAVHRASRTVWSLDYGPGFFGDVDRMVRAPEFRAFRES